jgi:hypothetical protein
MVIQKIVTLLDRWVTRGQTGNTTIEEEQPTIANPQIHRTPNNKELQQLTLHGHNLDLHDGEEYGDKITPKPSGIFRVLHQNIKLVPENPKANKNKQISNFISNGDADVYLLQEIGLCWQKLSIESQWSERLRSDHSLHSNLDYNNTEVPITENVQYGGVAIITKDEATHRFHDSGKDPSGLGRWAWTRIQGQENYRTRFVSVYRPCPSDGTSSVYAQHQRYFDEKHDDRDPRAAILEDLAIEMRTWREAGDCIIIGMDANEDVRNPSLVSFFKTFGMREAILERHASESSPPATYQRNMNRVPIDGIWCNRTLTAVHAGYFAFGDAIPSDHRALWIDFTVEEVLGQDSPPLTKPSARKLKANDPRLVNTYNKRATKAVKKTGLDAQLSELYTKSLSGWNPTLQEEFNRIHSESNDVRKTVEAKLRKLFMGGVPWSPKLQIYRDTIELWHMVVNKRKRIKVSVKRIRRFMSKTGLWQALEYNLEGASMFLTEAYHEYSEAKKKAQLWRDDHLDSLDAARAKKNNSTPVKERKARKHIERQRKQARNVKRIRQKSGKAAVTKLYYTENNVRTECSTKATMEKACISENIGRFSQTNDTPPMEGSMIEDLGYLAETDAKYHILNGTYVPPPDTDQYMREFIEEMRMPNSVRKKGPISTSIPAEEHRQGWKKQKERTAAESTGLSFSHHKAASESPTLAEMDRILRELPYKHGFSPELWQSITDFEILKKSGVYDVEKMRTLQLMVAEFNMNNKKLGRDVMTNAEETRELPDEQAGSRKNHQSSMAALNKVLTMDLLRLLRQAGGLCSNDAKSCYDRIVHWVAIVCLMRLGMPYEPIRSMFETLQSAWHFIATAFGISSSKYGRFCWPPLQGVGQGNGAGPAIWAVISAVLISMMHTHGHGVNILSALSMSLVSLACYAFVDDTDVVLSARTIITPGEETVPEMQEVVDRWEGGLRATGGALVPSKSYWYLLDFHWQNGKWHYRSIQDMPGNIHIRDTNGSRVMLTRLEPSDARETLGIMIAMDGNCDAEILHLRAKAEEFADQLRTGFIRKNDAWYALTATIMKTLEYPMPATTISEQDWEHIFKPIRKIGLPKAGFARNLPGTVLFGPAKFQGLSVMHPWYNQELTHLITACRETYSQSSTGRLLNATGEQLRLEMGLSGSFSDWPFDTMAKSLTECWLKTMLKFLHQFDIALHDTLPRLTKTRHKDIFLMEHFLQLGYSSQDIRRLNQCRMFLHATTLADICTVDGLFITKDAWNGSPEDHRGTRFQWPRRPPFLVVSEWTLWRRALTTLVWPGTSRKLLHPLGAWIVPPSPKWKWYYSTTEDRIYEKLAVSWQPYQKLNRRSGRRHGLGYYARLDGITEFGSTPPEGLSLASIERFPTSIQLLSTATWLEIPRTTRTPPSTLEEARQQRLHGDKWAISWFVSSDNGANLAEAIRKGIAYGVSDGSYKDERGTSAFLLEGGSGETNRIMGGNEIPGYSTEQSSYRAELGGIEGIIALVDCVVQVHSITSGSIRVGLDGEQAMLNAGGDWPLRPGQPDFDMLQDIRTKIKNSPLSWQFFWIESHQDKKGKSLDSWALLNIICDNTAKAFWNYVATTGEVPANHQFGNEGWSISTQGRKLSRIDKDKLYEYTFAPRASEYWSTKHNFPPRLFTSINWDAIDKAICTLPFGKKRWLVKHVSGFCGVGTVMKRRQEWSHSKCPRCNQPGEDTRHVLQCEDPRSRLAWARSLDELSAWMKKADTSPRIRTAIISRLQHWHKREQPTLHRLSPNIRAALQEQDEIGWYNFLLGRHSRHWERAQQAWILSQAQNERLSSSRRWAASLIDKTWLISWDMWEHRNRILHSPLHPRQVAEMAFVDSRIQEEYDTGTDGLIQKDKKLFRKPIHSIFKYPMAHKAQWLRSVSFARNRTITLRPMNQNAERSLMRNWMLPQLEE